MTATTTRTDWLLFILLGFLWGSSFLSRLGIGRFRPRSLPSTAPGVASDAN